MDSDFSSNLELKTCINISNFHTVFLRSFRSHSTGVIVGLLPFLTHQCFVDQVGVHYVLRWRNIFLIES